MTEIIDAHHHLWDLANREYPWLAGDAMAPIRRRYGVVELRAQTAKLGVHGTVLVQTVSTVEETVEFLGVAADHADLVRGVVGWVDMTDSAIVDRLGSLRHARGGERLVGIRHQVESEPDPEWLARPEVLRGLRAVAAAGLRYDLLVLPHQLPAAVEAVRAVPEGRFILDHAAKPPIAGGAWEPWAGLMTELAGFPNVACKLSGLVTEADWRQWSPADVRPYAERVLELFGPERVLFGSDWPVCELAAGYAEVFTLAEELCQALSQHERDMVFGGSAVRWYGI